MKKYDVIYSVNDLVHIYIDADNTNDAIDKANKIMNTINISNTRTQFNSAIIDFPHYYENYKVLAVDEIHK